ncbi:hypothetical protein HPP92_003743 [Vanilla planifolia]|uniref:Uncharacterized protein n=1 Tax=Vanilla planifolia TaxID=51239 RepID=A0A835SCH7_VANPL|nr:hypothetical protein HPP92_003743 [Vanilla planifolia]
MVAKLSCDPQSLDSDQSFLPIFSLSSCADRKSWEDHVSSKYRIASTPKASFHSLTPPHGFGSVLLLLFLWRSLRNPSSYARSARRYRGNDSRFPYLSPVPHPSDRLGLVRLSLASVAPLRRRLRLPPRHILCLFPSDPSVVRPFLFDSAAAAWAPLPTLPCSPFVYGLSNFATIALGHQLYVLGGSHFDARSYPLGLPLPSAAVHRLDLSVAFSPHLLSWTRLPDMRFCLGKFRPVLRWRYKTASLLQVEVPPCDVSIHWYPLELG